MAPTLRELTVPLARGAWAALAFHMLIELRDLTPGGLGAAGVAWALAAGWPATRSSKKSAWGLPVVLAASWLAALVALPHLPPVAARLHGPLAGLVLGSLCRLATGPVSGSASRGALPAAAAGLALGTLLPWGAPALALLPLLVRPPQPAALAALPLRQRLGPLLGLALAGAAAGAGWNALRGATDPSPAGALVTVLGVLLGAAATSRRAPSPAPLVVAGTCAMTTVGLVALAPDAVDRLLAASSGTDPRLVLDGALLLVAVPGGVALGAARSGGLAGPAALPAVLLGAWAGIDLGPRMRLAFATVALLAAAAGVVAGPAPRRRRALVAIAALAFLLPSWPESRLPEARATLLQAPDRLDRVRSARLRRPLRLAGWGPGGAIAAWGTRDRVLALEREGWRVEARATRDDLAAWAGHLGGAFAARTDRVLVLGDPLGAGTSALLTHLPERVTVGVPDPEGLGALAQADAGVMEPFVDPRVQLRVGPAEAVLAAAGDLDLLVEVARAPWPDALQALPGRFQVALRHRALAARGGTWVLALDLDLLDPEGLRGLLGALASSFPQVLVAVPEEGTDRLLLVVRARTEPVHWDQLLAAWRRGPRAWGALGVRSTDDIAALVLLDRAGATAVAAAGRHRSPVRLALPPGLQEPPSQLLPLLRPVLADPADWLDAGPVPEVLDRIRRRIRSRGSVLEVLDRAARGDLQAAVDEARAVDDPAALDPLVAPYLERARRLAEQGRAEGPTSSAWRAALSELAAARLVAPRSPGVAALEGEVRLALGDLRRADEAWRRALEAEPGRLDALLGRARVARLKGRADEALALLGQACERNPGAWRAWHALGVQTMALGRLDEAREALERAARLAGDTSPLPLAALAEVELQQGHLGLALGHAERALRKERSSYHLELRGRVRLELGQVEQAADDFRRAILVDPDNWAAHFGLGLVEARSGHPRRCIESFERVLALRPGNAAARRNLATCRAELGEDEPGP